MSAGPDSSWISWCRWWVAGTAGLTMLVGGQSMAQTVQLIPECGVAGETEICVSGAGWPEPDPVCRYLFILDGTTVAPDQPDGLFGPPSTSFVIPAGTSEGDHPVRVELRLNEDDSLAAPIITRTLRVITAETASSISHTVGAAAGGSGEAIEIDFECDCAATCDQIAFIQTVQRIAVVGGANTVTSITDYPAGCFSDAAARAAVETNPMRVRVDMFWSNAAPYYNVNDSGVLPSAGSTASYGQVGDCSGSNDTGLFDRPNTPPACFPTIGGVTATRQILRFESAPFCVAGADSGKFLGQVLTWEQQQDSGSTGTIENVTTREGQPSAEFTSALGLWVAAKYAGNLPVPQPAACE